MTFASITSYFYGCSSANSLSSLVDGLDKLVRPMQKSPNADVTALKALQQKLHKRAYE